ncbi:hypothetical protein PNH38_14730 [Anoxybacillus rupiensis]|jgi:hypothetical protein|uniref:DUF3244 domain-containing protein n=1 Tax=Anoxybacteroides rupiense TaxID=311460 RepID=A0ABT5W713_9BACL|nr:MULTISPECIES: hypothetical protein [Anoxybacillus]MBS2773163.1 hypothetical protein [Anoxybacillus rupiensis]MDE8565110.1 hypothetical protein [Anoxybacillus rupiensis]QHC02751.1 hypothetical protein GRQ40_01175 [Anoxybacillus sp. PDR2]
MLKRVATLIGVFSIIFAAVAFAASDSYDGYFTTSVMTIGSLNVSDGSISISHSQQYTLGRTVSIDAYRKGLLGYSKEKTVSRVSSDVTNKSLSTSGLPDGSYKLKFVEISGNCIGCREIHVWGSWSN